MDNGSSLPIRLLPSNLRPLAYRILSKKHSLNIKTDALALLTEVVSFKFGSDWKGVRSQQFLEEIARIWKSEDRGLFIDGDGLKQMLKVIENSNDTSKSDRALAQRSDTIVDDINIQEESTIDWKDYFRVICPPDQPHYQFDRHTKQFTIRQLKSGLLDKLGNNLNASIQLYSERYYLLLDRLSRNENFQKASFSSITSITNTLKNKTLSNEITFVKNLLGRDGQKFILFGLLSKNSNGDYILEDCTDYVELNISQTFKTEGSYYCLGMFVIVEGIYSASGGSNNKSSQYMGGCFHVSNIGHPPAEKRDISVENYGNVDFLGINKELDNSSGNEKTLRMPKQLKKKLLSLEKTLVDHKIIMLGSDCFLDDHRTVIGLKKLFKTIELQLQEESESIVPISPPLAIVMAGSFSSKPLISTSTSTSAISHSEEYKSNFDNLATLLSKFPLIIKSCKFILIPGANDPWQSTYSLGGSHLNLVPGRPIPQLFVSRLERLLPKGHLILGWNPTRINYLSQEIVIFKDTYTTKFKRNDIIFANDTEMEQQKIEEELRQTEEERINNLINKHTTSGHVPPKVKQARKMVKTILDQGNLQPFLPSSKLIDAHYDHVLRIEPMPNVIILHDSSFENFEVAYNNCKVVNITRLSSKSSRKLNYVEYFPAVKRFEFKELFY